MRDSFIWYLLLTFWSISEYLHTNPHFQYNVWGGGGGCRERETDKSPQEKKQIYCNLLLESIFGDLCIAPGKPAQYLLVAVTCFML